MQEQRTFGKYLRTERELRQIPLSEIAESTKIPVDTLVNLEDGRWENLPAEVYVRGFVHSYARHIGLIPNDVCQRYTQTIERIQEKAQPTIEPVGEAAEAIGGKRRYGLALVVIIILIIATITLSLFWRRGANADTQSSNGPESYTHSQPSPS